MLGNTALDILSNIPDTSYDVTVDIASPLQNDLDEEIRNKAKKLLKS